MTAPQVPMDSDLVKKTKKTMEKLTENLYIIGNEPTLACYRIQEHVHKSGPAIIDRGTEMKKLRRNLQACCFGIDYSIGAIKNMEESTVHFENIAELLKNAVFMKQQLDYEENIRARVRARQQPSQSTTAAKKNAFQRFSGSFDIPATLLSSSFTGLSNSASTDFKELKSVLSGQFKSQTSSSSKDSQEESKPSTSKDN